MHAAVGEWDACGNRFYSKKELYQMAWSDVDLESLRYAHLRFRGALRACRLRESNHTKGLTPQSSRHIAIVYEIQQTFHALDASSLEVRDLYNSFVTCNRLHNYLSISQLSAGIHINIASVEWLKSDHATSNQELPHSI